MKLLEYIYSEKNWSIDLSQDFDSGLVLQFSILLSCFFFRTTCWLYRLAFIYLFLLSRILQVWYLSIFYIHQPFKSIFVCNLLYKILFIIFSFSIIILRVFFLFWYFLHLILKIQHFNKLSIPFLCKYNF